MLFSATVATVALISRVNAHDWVVAHELAATCCGRERLESRAWHAQPRHTAHNRYADSNESYADFICFDVHVAPPYFTRSRCRSRHPHDQATLRRPGRAYLSAHDRVRVFNFASLVYVFGFSLVSKRKSHPCSVEMVLSIYNYILVLAISVRVRYIKIRRRTLIGLAL